MSGQLPQALLTASRAFPRIALGAEGQDKDFSNVRAEGTTMSCGNGSRADDTCNTAWSCAQVSAGGGLRLTRSLARCCCCAVVQVLQMPPLTVQQRDRARALQGSRRSSSRPRMQSACACTRSSPTAFRSNWHDWAIFVWCEKHSQLETCQVEAPVPALAQELMIARCSRSPRAHTLNQRWQAAVDTLRRPARRQTCAATAQKHSTHKHASSISEALGRLACEESSSRLARLLRLLRTALSNAACLHAYRMSTSTASMNPHRVTVPFVSQKGAIDVHVDSSTANFQADQPHQRPRDLVETRVN